MYYVRHSKRVLSSLLLLNCVSLLYHKRNFKTAGHTNISKFFKYLFNDNLYFRFSVMITDFSFVGLLLCRNLLLPQGFVWTQRLFWWMEVMNTFLNSARNFMLYKKADYSILSRLHSWILNNLRIRTLSSMIISR